MTALKTGRFASVRPPRFSPADRAVLQLYLLTRVGLWVIAYASAWMFAPDGEAKHAPSVLEVWERWDWVHYLHIAKDGYFPSGAGPGTEGWDNREAFFPGFPMALRAVHVVVPSWTASGLLISFVAGAVAVVALGRIARLEIPTADSGERAVRFLLLSPCAVFLAAGYTEALFLAFALPAWLAARRADWRLAGLLACGAATVRVSGLFVAAALAVQFAVTVRAHRAWRSAPWLLLPAVPPLAYTWYLQAHTGDWFAWKHAEVRGWYRDFHAPWESWRTTWQAAFDHGYPTTYAAEWQLELLGMVVGLVLLGVLLARRRWAEATYVGLTLWALGTSYWYMSIPRATLLWWPLWIGLAAWSMRRPMVTHVYLFAVAPLATVTAVAFLSGRWAG
ncbi:mannosyltransferase family protein [Yinghuangia seranimata]|uniref:mannosyltransferase family protein n=1 Tax=Yinghuangia seranimata TaxID=408067 RepID=UPI003CCF99E2